MAFEIVQCEQRSPEWFQARAGLLTSSRAADATARLKSGGEAAGRRNLRAQLVLERVMGKPLERTWASSAMQDGLDREPDAARLYEALTGRLLHRTGFVRLDGVRAGCSLDGSVGSDESSIEGIVEIKCPLAATHLDYIRSGVVPGDYLKQVWHQLWVTGAQWCDWLSYHPDFPPALQVKLVRIERSELELVAYTSQALEFLDDVDREEAYVLEQLKGGADGVA